MPGIKNLKSVPIESYEIFKSPWAPNIENEDQHHDLQPSAEQRGV